MADLARLFEPVRIGAVTLRNRIVLAPMTTGYEHQGEITPRSVAFYQRIARGGASLLVLGDVSLQPSLAPIPFAFDDRFIPSLRQLTETVHAEGACIAAQLFHQEYDTAEIAAVARAEGKGAALARLHVEMDEYANRISNQEITTILQRFTDAASRCQQAGFDVIQIHGDRLVGMFSSGVINRRGDEYGGSLANRARFPLQVVRAIREGAPLLPIEYKMAIIRTEPPMGKAGPTVDEAVTMAPWLVEAGVAAFHVSLANHGAIGDTIPGMGTQPHGCFVDLAARIKEAVDVPVTAVGRIVHPHHAAEILEHGQADLIALGRGLVADPDWPRLVQAGRLDEARLCIMCNHCTGSLTSGQPLECAINANLGGDPPKRTERPRRVLVAGGGPAGMEAARVAAGRGHRVTLVEKQPYLGGQLHLCAKPTFKDEIHQLTQYLTAALGRLEVDIRLSTALTVELLDEIRAEVVVVATGARPAPLKVPGGDAANVVTAWDALADTAEVGRDVVIIGGGAVGVETALFLAQEDRQITIVEMLDQIAQDESADHAPVPGAAARPSPDRGSHRPHTRRGPDRPRRGVHP